MDNRSDLKEALFPKNDSNLMDQGIELQDHRVRSETVQEKEYKLKKIDSNENLNPTDSRFRSQSLKFKGNYRSFYQHINLSYQTKPVKNELNNHYLKFIGKKLDLKSIYPNNPCSGREMLYKSNIKVSRQEKKHKLISNCDELYKDIFKKMIFDDYFKFEVKADYTTMKVTKEYARILIYSLGKSLIYILTLTLEQEEKQNEENQNSCAEEETKIPNIIEEKKSEIVAGESPDIEKAQNLVEVEVEVEGYRQEDDIEQNLINEEPQKSYIEKNKTPDVIILKSLKIFEFFEFTSYKDILILGNRFVILLWDLNENKLLKECKLEYKNPNHDNKTINEEMLVRGEIKHYKSIFFETKINIYFCISNYILNINININCELKNPSEISNLKNKKVELLVETHYIELIDEPDIFYINTDEMIIAAIVSRNEDIQNSTTTIEKEENKRKENLTDNKNIGIKKDLKKYIQKIYIINCDNMQISFYPENDQFLPNNNKDFYSTISRKETKSYFDDIYLKICRSGPVVELKVIRNFENKLYIRKISITTLTETTYKKEVKKIMPQNSDKELDKSNIPIKNNINTTKNNNSSNDESVQQLNVSFGKESPVSPEFFSKYDVKKIQNSIVDTLMISYTSQSLLFPNFLLNQKSKMETVLIDYNLETEIKKFNTEDEFQFTDLSEFTEESKAKIVLDNKLIFIHQDRYLKVLSLSNLKVEPILKLDKYIDKIFYFSSYLLILAGSNSSKSEVYLFKLHIDSKGDLSPILKEEDIKNMSSKFDKEQKKNVIFALCHAKDSENLKVFINWKKKNNSPNFENFPIKKTIDDQALGCTETLLNYICNMEEDDPHFIIMLHEIEDYFEDILKCGCISVPPLLDKLIGSSIEYGTPKSDYLPMYTTFDHRGSSLRGCFFGNTSGEQKDYQINYSHIKLSSTLGTKGSLKLTKCLCDIEDMKIFGTDFIKIYIRLKWASLRLGIIGLTILMWINIFLVASLVTSNNAESKYYKYYIYSFYIVNAALIISEIIQAVNLGVRDYFGISSINYSSILQLATSILIVFFYSDPLVLTFYVLAQALTVQEVFTKIDNTNPMQTDDEDNTQDFVKSTSSNDKEENRNSYFNFISRTIKMIRNWLKQGEKNQIILSIFLVAIFCLPTILFLMIFIFTNNHFYFFIAIGMLEVFLYAYSYKLWDYSIGQRLGFQSFCVIMYVFYGNFNIYLLILNMLLLTLETLNFIKIEWTKNHIFDFACSSSVNGLIIYSYYKGETLYCIIGMLVSVSYLLIRSAVYYMNRDEKLRLMNAFCYRYGTYFLLAYQMTNIIELAYCFIIFNVIEFVWIRSDAYKSFFEDIFKMMINWNTIDILRYVISVFWIFMYETGQLKLLKQDDQKAYMRILNWVFVLLNIIKALLGFRAFDKTRFYVRLILKCIVDIIPFLIIFVFFTLSFGLLKMVETSSDDFQSFWTDAIDQSIGGFEHGENNYLEYTMFTMGTLLIIIVMLNLLIAVLSDTFAKFLDEAQQIDYKSMIETVYEVEVLLFWRKFVSSSSKYFASFDNITPSIIEVQTPWQSRLDLLLKTITENDKTMKKFIENQINSIKIISKDKKNSLESQNENTKNYKKLDAEGKLGK